jgi:hypothetical protein
MASISARLAQLPGLAHQALDYARARPAIAVAAATGAALVLGAAPLAAYASDSYATFLAIGPGGVPYNVFGWLFQASLKPFARRDLVDGAPAALGSRKHDAKYGPHARTSFLGDDLPERAGRRPKTPTLVLPQRQTSDASDAARVAAMNAHLASLAASRPDALRMQASGLESPDNPALWVRSDADAGPANIPSYLKSTKGEIVHVHPEGSTHMVLSLADAEQAARRGWAQFHSFSGVVFPLSYMFVYAPRDEAEVEVWKRLVTAAVAFNTAGSA